LHDTCESIPLKYEKDMHDLEDPCEEYNCWAQSSHCGPMDEDYTLLDVADFKERAFDKCAFTEEDAKRCLRDPEASEDGSTSAAYAAIFLTYFLA
jgi:hypothetical protein